MVSYQPMLPNIAGILHRLHPVLQSSKHCSEVIPGVPMVAFRRPTSLNDMLVHSELKTPGLVTGFVRCGDGRCRICRSLVEGENFRSYVINFKMDCDTDHVIYLLCCSKCSKQYVGSTITKFRTRFTNLKSRLSAHKRLSTSNKTLDDLIYKHFNQREHKGVDDLRVQLIDKCASEFVLREREAQWAYHLKTISPLGLNSDDFFLRRNPRRDLF